MKLFTFQVMIAFHGFSQLRSKWSSFWNIQEFRQKFLALRNFLILNLDSSHSWRHKLSEKHESFLQNMPFFTLKTKKKNPKRRVSRSSPSNQLCCCLPKNTSKSWFVFVVQLEAGYPIKIVLRLYKSIAFAPWRQNNDKNEKRSCERVNKLIKNIFPLGEKSEMGFSI